MIFLLLGTLPLVARAGAPPLSFQRAVLPVAGVQQVLLPPTAAVLELLADAKAGNTSPLRFAVPREVALTPANSGTWEEVAGGRLWRLRVVSSQATDLNFGFARFWLPEGATLHISAESEPYFQGPYTAADHQPDGQLWTAVVPGEAAVVELFVPRQAQAEPQLLLTQVGTGYRDFWHRQKGLVTPKAQGTCNNDVICPEGISWRNEIRSVAVYTKSGIWTCTGTLVMNAAGDFRPFFLTANHCGVNEANAGSVVVYWNYESATCGTHGPGSLAQNQSGAIFRAARYDVDFALLELKSLPDPSFRVYYSGWDRSGAAPSGCVGIHHPDCDVKAISFSTTPLATVDSCIGTGGAQTHWHVLWASGVTEPGSSGSGIWDPSSHRLVGTLSGGNSTCGGSDLTDCYGKFSVAWEGGISSASRLRDWLDPQDTGVTGVPGADPMLTSVLVLTSADLVSETCSPTNGVIDPGELVTVRLALKNFGGGNTTNLVATLLATNGVALPGPPQDYGALASGDSAARSFSFTAGGACGGTLNPVLQLQDGTRDLGTVSYLMGEGAVSFALGIPNPSLFFSEAFDDVAAPALPGGWTTSSEAGWVTTTAQRETLPNSAFALDPSWVSDHQLTSPAISVQSANSQLTFRHYYAMEFTYDGGVLEISINGGAFTDIMTAGGSFVSGAYSGTISSSYGNPLGGRLAWTGSSGGFISTIIALPTAAAGANIQLRWRLGSDSSMMGTGWYLDTVSLVQDGYTCCTGEPPKIKTPPHRQLVLPGCDATFSVVAKGTAPLSYQWFKDEVALTSQTEPSLSFFNVQTNDFGNYSVVITNFRGAATSSPAVLGLNHLPVVGSATVERFAAGGLRMKAEDLLLNDTDPDGDSLTVIGVSPTSAAGGTVTFDGRYVFYQPPPGFTKADSFPYAVSDGNCGGTATGLVTVQVKADNLPTSKATLEPTGEGSLRLSFDGLPGGTYRIQYADSVSPPLWQDLTTQTADAFGVWGYIEASSTNPPTRYYRSVWP